MAAVVVAFAGIAGGMVFWVQVPEEPGTVAGKFVDSGAPSDFYLAGRTAGSRCGLPHSVY